MVAIDKKAVSVLPVFRHVAPSVKLELNVFHKVGVFELAPFVLS